MNLDELARDAGAEVRGQVATIEPPASGAIARRSRRGRMATGVAAIALIALAGAGLAVTRHDDPEPTGLQVTDDPEPTTTPGGAPVWYDADGLHHGDVVEQTPIDLMGGATDTMAQALALVRSGAVYLDPATGDVWFHPWGGEPRIVGHNSEAGPGGDPDGDTAAWFDGSDLVVYDTAADREIARTDQGGRTAYALAGDHWPAGNTFLQVTAERVVWQGNNIQGEGEVYRHDLRSGRTTAIRVPAGRRLVDVHDGVQTLHEFEPGALVLRVPGRAEQRYPDLEARGRLSPSGNHALAVEETGERHAAAIVDTRTGEVWPVPRNAYPWIAWSYGDIALVDTEDALLACDAARRSCEQLHPERPFLLPTN